MRKEEDSTYFTNTFTQEEICRIAALGPEGLMVAISAGEKLESGGVEIRYRVSQPGIMMQKRLQRLACEAGIPIECSSENTTRSRRRKW